MEIMRTLLLLSVMCCVCLALPFQKLEEKEKTEIPGTPAATTTENKTLTEQIEEVNKGIILSGKYIISDLDIAYNIKRVASACPKSICLWPKSNDGRVYIPYVLSSDFDVYQSVVIQTALLGIEDATCIRFIKQTSEVDYLSYEPQDGCWSSLGRTGGKHTVSLDKSGCIWTGIATHETLHALGLSHEHVRKDRDNYVKVLWENIQDGYSAFFEVADTLNMDLTKYDYGSIMHYSKNSFSKSNMPTLEAVPDSSVRFGQGFVMTDLDIMKINLLYQCTPKPYSALRTITTTPTTTTTTPDTTTSTTTRTTTKTTTTTTPTTTKTTPTTTTPTTTRTTPKTTTATTTKPTTTRTTTTTTKTTRTTPKTTTATTTKPTTTRTTTTTTKTTRTTPKTTTATTTKPTTTRTTTTTTKTTRTTPTTTTTKPTTTRTTPATTTSTTPTTTRTTKTRTTQSTTKVSTTSTTTPITKRAITTTTTATPISVTSNACGGVLTAPQGVITSPNFPNNYPNNAYCHWNITLTSKFKVTFTDFVLEGYMSNCFDKLQIYNGGYFISSYRSVFCGQTLPPPITSQQNTMQIVFTSDFADPWKGFRLEYETV